MNEIKKIYTEQTLLESLPRPLRKKMIYAIAYEHPEYVEELYLLEKETAATLIEKYPNIKAVQEVYDYIKNNAVEKEYVHGTLIGTAHLSNGGTPIIPANTALRRWNFSDAYNVFETNDHLHVHFKPAINRNNLFVENGVVYPFDQENDRVLTSELFLPKEKEEYHFIFNKKPLHLKVKNPGVFGIIGTSVIYGDQMLVIEKSKIESVGNLTDWFNYLFNEGLNYISPLQLSSYVAWLPKDIQDAIRAELQATGMTTEDIENGMASRVHDLTDSIDLEVIVQRIKDYNRAIGVI